MIPWRDTPWWRCAQGLGSQDDPSNRTGWKHDSSYTGRHIPWERILCQVMGEDWRKNFAIGARSQ
eukprot:11897342-Alexandrium_andersonii.AAC.1